MFDISKLDTATAADEGRVMEIVTPTGQVARDENGKPVTITLLGRHSAKAQEHQMRAANRRFEAARRTSKTSISAEQIDEEGAELLAALTAAWSFTKMDGADFPCTEENARKLWMDRRFKSVREQADRFIADDTNFTKG